MNINDIFLNTLPVALDKIDNKMQSYKKKIKELQKEVDYLKANKECKQNNISNNAYNLPNQPNLPNLPYTNDLNNLLNNNSNNYKNEINNSINSNYVPNNLNSVNSNYGPTNLTPIKNIVQEVNNNNMPLNLNLNGDEYKLSCVIKNNVNIITAADNLLFSTIKTAVKVGVSDDEILKLMKPEITDNIYLIKTGFSDEENKKLLNIIKNNVAPNKEFTDITQNNFEKVMSAFYPFTYNIEYQIKIIDKNMSLQNKVVEKFNSLFCGDFSWDEIKNLLNNENDKWLLLDILINLSNCPGSIFRRNLGNKPYIRYKKSPNKDSYDFINYDQLGCKIDTATNKNNKIVLGSSFYTVYDDMVFAKVLKKYNRKYLAGPSGSTVLLYVHVFDVLGYERSKLNNDLLLGTIIANYVPIYHTVTEILLSSSFETGNKYVISMDPVEFVINEMKSSNII